MPGKYSKKNANALLTLEEKAQLSGEVKRIIWSKPEEGFYIISLQEDLTGKRITAKGPMGELSENQHVNLHGTWVNDARYGQQFKVSYVERSVVSTPEGIKRFLMHRISGIGEKTAQDIVDRFGLETFEVLEKDPSALVGIAGIGPGRVKQILNDWRKEKGSHQGMAFLLQYLPGPALAQNVYAKYGEASEEVVRANPYILIGQVRNIGFTRADEIAQKLGVPVDAPARIQAGIEHALSKEGKLQGHVYLKQLELVAAASELLGVGPTLILDQLAALVDAERVVVEEERIYSAEMYKDETDLAAHLNALLAGRTGNKGDLLTQDLGPQALVAEKRQVEMVAAATKMQNITPSAQQSAALVEALRSRLLVITGGPGTGKTTIIKALCVLYEQIGIEYKLLSYTGKASRRLAEATGRKAYTIHRYLHEIGADETTPIPTAALIIDEISMLDVSVAAWLFRRITAGHRVVLVGDADQLPSVGPGAVLKDIIQSKAVPTIPLRDIFRQALDSGIVLNAHSINKGVFPQNYPDDCELILEESTDEIAELVKNLAVKYKAVVLTPQYKGAAGVDELNQELQARLNPKDIDKGELLYGKTIFRLSDPVIVGQNNYEKGIFNGEVGTIISVSEAGMTVAFDENNVVFSKGEMADLKLCYALTVHKAQGSEYEAVVIPCVKQHAWMWARNLLYTAVTRARKRVYIVGQKSTVQKAIANDTPSKRNSYLKERLAGPQTDVESILF